MRERRVHLVSRPAAVGFNWYLAGARRLLRWPRPIEIVSGVLLVSVGVLLFTGRFNALSSFLVGFGQLVNGNDEGPVA